MATLEQRLAAIIPAIGVDIKALRTANGDLTLLSTTAKANLVAAINEVYTLAQTSTGVIDDAAGNGVVDKTWSADKIFDSILAAINSLRTELTNGASGALDTFGEIAAALAADESTAAALAISVSNRVRFDAAQTLTAEQQTQARTNIGAADATALTALTTAVGNTDADLLTIYTTAKT